MVALRDNVLQCVSFSDPNEGSRKFIEENELLQINRVICEV